MTSPCPVCGLPARPSRAGRPSRFCSDAHRRVAEIELRRLDRRLERLEDERVRGERLGATFGDATVARDLVVIDRAIAAARSRLVELVERLEALPGDAPETAGEGRPTT